MVKFGNGLNNRRFTRNDEFMDNNRFRRNNRRPQQFRNNDYDRMPRNRMQRFDRPRNTFNNRPMRQQRFNDDRPRLRFNTRNTRRGGMRQGNREGGRRRAPGGLNSDNLDKELNSYFGKNEDVCK